MSITRGLPRPLFTHNPLRLPLVRVQNGTFYKQKTAQGDRSSSKLFTDLTFEVPAPGKEIWAVVGPGSSGKTTFLEILRGLYACDPPAARTFPGLVSSEGGVEQRLDPLRAIRYVGFGSADQKLGPGETKGAYLSARFESRREASDYSLTDYLIGNVKLNPDESEKAAILAARTEYFFQFVAERLNLHNLLDMPVTNLSNGQTRRARVAKAIMAKPHLLLLDEPFIGLDPMTKKSFTSVLHRFVRENDLPMVFALQAQEEIPSFVTHVLCLGADRKEEARGRRDTISSKVPLLFAFKSPWKHFEQISHHTRKSVSKPTGETATPTSRPSEAESEAVNANGVAAQSTLSEHGAEVGRQMRHYSPLWWNMEDSRPVSTTDTSADTVVEMSGIKVSYGDRTILGDWEQDHDGQRKSGLWWNIRPGDRWGVFGPNGSGKTTLLSLICSDHPQAYSLPLKLFGRSRLPEPSQPGISIFDLQARIGQSSPEVLNFFPRNLTVRQSLESAWADTFLSKPRLSYTADSVIDACLRWFRPELDPTREASGMTSIQLDPDSQAEASMAEITEQSANYLDQDLDWAETVRFRELSLEGQKVVLFLRAIVRKPELVILDEAFSGMDEPTRIKCMLFLAYGESWVYSDRKAGAGNKFKGVQDRSRVRSALDLKGDVTFAGLEPSQALLCVAHRRQEVPPILQQWLCLPESGEELDSEPGSLPDQCSATKHSQPHASDHQRASLEEGQAPPPPAPSKKKAPARFGSFRFGQRAGDDDWLRGSWWQRMWGGESWSPDGSYMMLEKLPFYKWQNQRRRKGYDIRQAESRWGQRTWLKRFTGAEARRQQLEWRAGRKARADWESGTRARVKEKRRQLSRERSAAAAGTEVGKS